MPFEEDPKDPTIFFLDHDFLDACVVIASFDPSAFARALRLCCESTRPPNASIRSMYAMCKKVSAKERILGFYSTGPRIRPADIHIDALFRCVPAASWAMRCRGAA